jgi:uncharacterized protein (DUF697 family)
MTPNTLQELDRIKYECQSLVNKRALLAAAGAVVPLPGLDIVVDVGLLAGMVPEISKRFGLAKEQVDEYDEATKLFVFELVRQTGAKLVARNVTRDTVLSLLKKMGVQTTGKRFSRFIPIVGSLVSGGIGFAAMRYLGKSHVDECYEVAKRIVERRVQAAEAERRALQQRVSEEKPTVVAQAVAAPEKRAQVPAEKVTVGKKPSLTKAPSKKTKAAQAKPAPKKPAEKVTKPAASKPAKAKPAASMTSGGPKSAPKKPAATKKVTPAKKTTPAQGKPAASRSPAKKTGSASKTTAAKKSTTPKKSR